MTLSSNKMQNGDILVPANPDPSGKMAVKMERERALLAVLNKLTNQKQLDAK